MTTINVSRKWIEWAEWAASLCTANSPFPGHVYCRHPVGAANVGELTTSGGTSSLSGLVHQRSNSLLRLQKDAGLSPMTDCNRFLSMSKVRCDKCDTFLWYRGCGTVQPRMQNVEAQLITIKNRLTSEPHSEMALLLICAMMPSVLTLSRTSAETTCTSLSLAAAIVFVILFRVAAKKKDKVNLSLATTFCRRGHSF